MLIIDLKAEGNKHIMTVSTGKQWVLCPQDPQCSSLFAIGQFIIKCFVIPPNTKMEKPAKKIIHLMPADIQICNGFKIHAKSFVS